MFLTYAMTAYGFYQGEAAFTAGAQIGCITLGLIVGTFSYVMWCVLVGGYDLMTAIAVSMMGVIERRAKAAAASANEASAASADPKVTATVASADSEAPAADTDEDEEAEAEEESEAERYRYECAAEEKERRETVEGYDDTEPQVNPL
jgi:hypothetical protein